MPERETTAISDNASALDPNCYLREEPAPSESEGGNPVGCDEKLHAHYMSMVWKCGMLRVIYINPKRICGHRRFDCKGGDRLMMRKEPAVYIMASRRNGTLYAGVTSDLSRRVWEHRTSAIPGFTQRYGVHMLVYCEYHDDMTLAIQREKHIKK